MKTYKRLPKEIASIAAAYVLALAQEPMFVDNGPVQQAVALLKDTVYDLAKSGVNSRTETRFGVVGARRAVPQRFGERYRKIKD